VTVTTKSSKDGAIILSRLRIRLGHVTAGISIVECFSLNAV